ncbi:MAG: PQQ-binding-like beta-propeller repeat protein [Bacteroidales bacterium]|nr:PQQ-binding-like beta-propeller repeat protein [Bacteroidales bacterium]
MTISVECPHCETTFQLESGLLGKAMRCPNADCREVFVVRAAGPDPRDAVAVEPGVTIPPPEPVDPSESYPALPARAPSEVVTAWDSFPHLTQPSPPEPRNANDFWGIPTPPFTAVAATPIPPPPPVVPPSSGESAPPVERVPTVKAVPVAQSITPTRPAGPREVVWSGHAPPTEPTAERMATPPQPAPLSQSTQPAEPTEPESLMRRRRKNPWPKRILFGFVGLFLTLLGAGAFLWIQYTAKAEERAAQEAESSYMAGNFGTSSRQYQTLVMDYPSSTLSEKYKFFAALAETRSHVESVVTRQHPEEPLAQLQAFLAEFGNSPFAQPGSGFGSDIITTGRKLIDALADHAGDRLKASRAESRQMGADWAAHLEQCRKRGTPNADFLAAEQTLAAGEALIPTLDRFREKEGLSFDDQRKNLAEVRSELDAERRRETALAPWRDLPAEPTDLRIESLERAMRTAGLSDDPEAKQIILWAQQELRKRIVGIAGYRRAEPPPRETTSPVLFSAPVLGYPKPERTDGTTTDVVFAVARGVLYALDAATGERLWGTRIGEVFADRREADLPVRFTLADGRTDWVLVASFVDGQPALTARDARTGQPIWYQPLDARLAGRPLILGRRVYVPLADSVGTVIAIQIATGDRLATLTIRQRIGGSLVGALGTAPGIYHLWVPGDARRVFAFAVGAESEDGTPLPPRLIRDLQTGHPRDSLTGTVLLTGRQADGTSRFLILTQADGQKAMKVRCFALDGGDPPPSADVAVAGWSSFPAVTNGERVVIASDAGTYAVLGVNQAGNQDRPIFALPGTAPPTEARGLSPGLVVAVQEDSAWVLLQRELVRLRTAVDPARGLRMVRNGPSIPVGDPIHRAQVRPTLQLGVVVTRSASASGVYATAFDLGSGQVRWRQQLGAVGTVRMSHPGGVPILVDEQGGLFHATASTVIAPPVPEPIGPARFLTAGTQAWGLIPIQTAHGKRLRVRQMAFPQPSADTPMAAVQAVGTTPATPQVDRPAQAVQLLQDVEIPLPATIVGNPVAHAGRFLVPLANGNLYRLTADGRTLERGARWRAAGVPENAPCFVCAINPTQFLVTDGGRGITLRDWPARDSGSNNSVPSVTTWESREPLVLGPCLLQTEPLQFLVADQSGSVALFGTSQRLDPIRRWRVHGKPSWQLTTLRIGHSVRIVTMCDRRTVIGLDPERAEAEPQWAVPETPLPEGLEWIGWAIEQDRVLITDQTGRVTIVEGKTGRIESGGLPQKDFDLAAGPAVPVDEATALLPMISGTVLRLPYNRR